MGENTVEILAIILSNPAVIIGVLSLVEIILGAIPNNVLPYKSVILKILQSIGKKSESVNNFEIKKDKQALK